MSLAQSLFLNIIKMIGGTMSVHEICFTVIVLLEKSQILFLGSRCQIGEFTYWTRSYWRLEGCCCSFVALDEASVGGARLLRQP